MPVSRIGYHFIKIIIKLFFAKGHKKCVQLITFKNSNQSHQASTHFPHVFLIGTVLHYLNKSSKRLIPIVFNRLLNVNSLQFARFNGEMRNYNSNKPFVEHF